MLKVLVVFVPAHQGPGVECDTERVGIGERPLVDHHPVDDAVSLVVKDWPASASSAYGELRSQTFEVCYLQLYAIVS